MKMFSYFLCAFGGLMSSAYADCWDAHIVCESGPDGSPHVETAGCKATGLFGIGGCQLIKDDFFQAQKNCNKGYGGVNYIIKCDGSRL